MSEASLELGSQSEKLEEAIGFLQQFWQSEGLPEGADYPFTLALEELFVNVSMHGTTDATHPPRVKVTLRRQDDQVELVFRDEGTPFDPLSLPPPNLSDDIEERGVGGLGIFLIKEMMDDLEYRHEDGWNCLRLAKRVGAG